MVPVSAGRRKASKKLIDPSTCDQATKHLSKLLITLFERFSDWTPDQGQGPQQEPRQDQKNSENKHLSLEIRCLFLTVCFSTC